jgi:5-methylcytosine-specific restriction endonuclease McrA
MKRNSAQRDRDRARIRVAKPNCHICGKEILWDADWLDPLSFVVDHVIPLAKGGEDALSNKKAAHRRQTVSATARSGHDWWLPSSSAVVH